MKKRLLSLFLAIATLAGFSSCGKGSAKTDSTSAADYNMTLTLWLPTSEDTTEESIALVEAAINEITKKAYNTAIDITAIPEDEYDEAIKNKVLAVEEAENLRLEEEQSRKKAERDAKKKGETLPPRETETAAPSTFINEDGQVEQFYPEAGENQLDIFCIRGYDNFAFFADNAYLAPLDESLAASSKLLKSYVFSSLLEYAKIPGDTSTYAIPNNHVVGEYTYLLVNKRLCEALKYDISEFTVDGLTALDSEICTQFITDIGMLKDNKSTAIKGIENVDPLLDFYYDPNVLFWNGDGDTSKFSVIASYSQDTDEPDKNREGIGSVFNDSSMKRFLSTMTMMKSMQDKGYIAKDPSKSTEFGVGLVSCSNIEIAEYTDEYHAIVIKNPRVDNDDVFQSMFGVSMYSLDVDRSMEIVTAINTDPTIRTILQYGVEGIHWDYNEDLTENGEQTIKFLDKSSTYKMNLVDTGNVFMTYPGENLPISNWEMGKAQNRDSRINPFLGFSGYMDEKTTEAFEKIDKFSEEMLAKINDMTAEEFEGQLKYQAPGSNKKKNVLDSKVKAENAYADITEPTDSESLVFKWVAFWDETYGKNLTQV